MKAPGFSRVVKAGLTTVAGVGMAHALYAELRSRSLRPPDVSEHRVICGTGNMITYYVREGLPGGPTLVCEAGLMGTSTSWLPVLEHLDRSLRVVVYDRAGYRKSVRCCDEEYCLSESVDDLRDVLEAVTDGDSPVFLAAHSLGGYLAHRAVSTARRFPDAQGQGPVVSGVVLVDPTHPRQLLKSPQQRQGAHGTDLLMRLGPLSSLLGGPALLDKRRMFGSSSHRRHLELEYSANSTWRSARREWRPAYALMLDGDASLRRAPVPIAVVASEETIGRKGQRELFEEYVSLGVGGEVIVVSDTTHLSVLISDAGALRTAAEIERLVAAWAERGGDASPGPDEAPKEEER